MQTRRPSKATITALAALAAALAVSPAAAYGGGGHSACRADVEKLCPDAKPGDHGAMRTCLHDHEADLSDGCKQAMAHWKGHHHHGSTGSADTNGGGADAPSNQGSESND